MTESKKSNKKTNPKSSNKAPSKLDLIKLMNEARKKSGNLGGRPKDYTPEELLVKSQEYFDLCDSIKIDRGINGVITKPYTMSGLRLWLGVGKNYISNLKGKKEFEGTVAYIRNLVENDVEEKTLVGLYSPSAGSFNLKNNFNWVDKQEVEQTTKTVNYSPEQWEKLTDEEIDKIINE